ncbi:MAG: acetyl-CoA C-acyltransferase [Thermoanaerobaculia bacterium]|nr:acetyl-CoA C-acyltransferase [Thermoanaerobaculia bacterium]
MSAQLPEIVFLSAARTPIGSFQGALSSLTAPQLGTSALSGAIDRAGLEPAQIDQVYMGCVLPAGLGQAPARQASLGAGCPTSTGAITLNKVCGSGMRAIMSAANDLRCGEFEVAAAGGMECMSQAPYVARVRDGLRLGHGQLVDSMIHDGLWDPYNDQHMGNCAESCATEYGLGRDEQDAFAVESYRRAIAAQENGASAREIVPVEVPQRRGESRLVDTDEEPGRVDFDKLKTLRPAFQRDGGTVTAANASTINDGAAALVLTTAAHADRLGRKPVARLVAQATHSQEPEWFTTAPVNAMKKALDRAGLAISDIDLFEINEAFAVVVLAAIRDLGLDAAKVNLHGGAVALGHPIGASGARIVVTLLHALKSTGGRYGCAGICLGGGEATSIVVERID